MPPLQQLDVAAGIRGAPARGEGQTERGKVVRAYKWYQFHGKEQVTEFDEAHFSLEGLFAQSSSQGHKEYQDRLRVVHLRGEGLQKAEIAKALGRSEKFVAKWWQKEVKEIPKPWGVHEYLTKNMGRNENDVGATNGAAMTDDSVNDTATWWRDVEVRRKFTSDLSIYDDILKGTEWKGSNARTRDFATGAYHLKYDRFGNIRWEGHQGGKYKQGTSPAMDKAMQRLFHDYGIADRTSGVIVNWYPDGQGNLGSHRHDCWTALFSFGQERILTVDNTPLLMQDGDLVIFGTQRHGVPIMPEVTEGRITLVVFFYPTSMQKKGMWQTITDPETMEASAPFAKMLSNQHLAAGADKQQLQIQLQQQRGGQGAGGATANDKQHEARIVALQELGFSRMDAQMALQASSNDVQRAAEVLLMAGIGGTSGAFGASDAPNMKQDVTASAVASSQQPPLSPQAQQRVGRFRKRASNAEVGSDTGEGSKSAVASTSYGEPSGRGGSTSVAGFTEDTDEALACRLQFGEEFEPSSGIMSDAEVAALALQLDEMEAGRGFDNSLLAAQFQEYDDMLTLKDAERWNGQGDLMHSPFSREHLSIDSMDKTTIYSFGHGDLLEKDFWEVLQCNSIRVLYDVRPTDHRGEHRARHPRFAVTALKAQCRSRGIVYKHMPIGRESAYGVLAHIESDEGKHTLVELAWQAARKRTAFMGSEEYWQDDARQVIAEKFALAGHTVHHVDSTGGLARHSTGVVWPDWLQRQEERLRLLEKKRQAGEMAAPQKSRTDRSSEVVAAALTRPPEEVDAMREMRDAANQKELVVAQRKLARYQRIAEEKGALAKKVVTSTPHWIMEDARKQAEWVAAKKQEKDKATASVATSSSSSQPAATFNQEGGGSSTGFTPFGAEGAPPSTSFARRSDDGAVDQARLAACTGDEPTCSNDAGVHAGGAFGGSAKREGPAEQLTAAPSEEDSGNSEAVQVPFQQQQRHEAGERHGHHIEGCRESEQRQQPVRTSWRGRRVAAR